ncbi:MAG: hypothetical protein ACYCYO_16510 [Bacilli bacterium]
MVTVTACAYDEQSTTDTLVNYYAQGGYKMMADYLVGSSAYFGIQSLLALAIGELENGGPGGNWMQLSTGTGGPIASFQSFWSSHNFTGQPTPSTTQIEDFDAINAAAGVFWLHSKYNCGYSNWQGALSQASGYNGNCGCSCPYSTAYGYSALFLAYGENYQVSSYNYQGAQYPTSPTGTSQTKYLSPSCGPAAPITVPTITVGAAVRSNPYGRNSNGKQIVLLAKDNADYISALQISMNLIPGYQPVVTGDAAFAARSTQYSSTVCVIAAGGPSATQLEYQCSALGLSCTSATSFSEWETYANSGSPAFINATGQIAADSYNLANSAASQAQNAGW